MHSDILLKLSGNSWCLLKLQIQLKYHMTSTPLRPNSCSIKVLLGIAWLKGTKHQKKAAKNVMMNSANRLREIFSEVEKEVTSRKGNPFENQLIPHTRLPVNKLLKQPWFKTR